MACPCRQGGFAPQDGGGRGRCEAAAFLRVGGVGSLLRRHRQRQTVQTVGDLDLAGETGTHGVIVVQARDQRHLIPIRRRQPRRPIRGDEAMAGGAGALPPADGRYAQVRIPQRLHQGAAISCDLMSSTIAIRNQKFRHVPNLVPWPEACKPVRPGPGRQISQAARQGRNQPRPATAAAQLAGVSRRGHWTDCYLSHRQHRNATNLRLRSSPAPRS